MGSLSKVTIVINCGNEAMQTEGDLIAAMKVLMNRIYNVGLGSICRVMDINGNAVGTVDVEMNKA